MASTTVAVDSRGRTPGADSRAASGLGFRSDIQGLRALAVVAVVLYHADMPGLRGGFVGVDVFFVVSGFIITSLLLRECLTTGRVSLRAFWARRVRRILPAASATLLVTSLASILWLPRAARFAASGDLASAALSVANWRFAWQSTDYLAQDRDPSPVLHYWSLGVEEQFYLVWPLVVALLLLGVSTGRRAERVIRRRLAAALVIVVVASFLYGLTLTSDAQPYAFFGSPSRAWQLGVGALLAVTAHSLNRLPVAGRALLGWAGAAMLALTLVSVSEAGTGSLAYPGWVALFPTLATAAVIAAGTGGSVPWLGRAADLGVIQYVGNISYSWYLWHWPVLVFTALLVEDAPGWMRALAVLGSFGLASASFRWIEQPLRYPRGVLRGTTSTFALGGLLVVASLVAAVLVAASVRLEGPTRVRDASGQALTLRPDPADAAADMVSMRSLGCELDTEDATYRECLFGPPSQQRIVVFGDSHAGHLYPGMLAAAEAQGWQLQVLSKSSCQVADVVVWHTRFNRIYHECSEWRESALANLVAQRQTLVVISSRTTKSIIDPTTGELMPGSEAHDAWVSGMRRTVTRLTDAGIDVVVLRDVPTSPGDVPTCVEESVTLDDCVIEQSSRILEREAAQGIPGATYADFTPRFCDNGLCPIHVGDILVYRDRSHLTATFARTLDDFFEDLVHPYLR